MTRHSRNSTNSSKYTYHERQKDCKQSGYGSLKERLGADAIKPFDCCSLTLQPCKDPMITPDGYIFDKEAILSYIVEQKKEQKRLMKAYEKWVEMEDEKKAQTANADFDEKKRKFCAMESTPAHIFMPGYQKPSSSKRKSDANDDDEPQSKRNNREGALSNTAGDKANHQWKSFWVPELSTSAEADKMEKPSGKILNPMNGKPLKFKDLMPVIFTPVNEDATTARVHSMEVRYKCPVTGDGLVNSGRAAYLKTSQHVVSWSVVEKIIRKDWIDPLTNKKIEESDIIELQRGGTGFASANQLDAKVIRPQLAFS